MLDAKTLADYQKDGAVPLRGVISPEWIARLREGVEENLNQPGPYAKHYTPEGNPGRFFGAGFFDQHVLVVKIDLGRAH